MGLMLVVAVALILAVLLFGASSVRKILVAALVASLLCGIFVMLGERLDKAFYWLASALLFTAAVFAIFFFMANARNRKAIRIEQEQRRVRVDASEAKHTITKDERKAMARSASPGPRPLISGMSALKRAEDNIDRKNT